jgi:hypothetical protein
VLQSTPLRIVSLVFLPDVFYVYRSNILAIASEILLLSTPLRIVSLVFLPDVFYVYRSNIPAIATEILLLSTPLRIVSLVFLPDVFYVYRSNILAIASEIFVVILLCTFTTCFGPYGPSSGEIQQHHLSILKVPSIPQRISCYTIVHSCGVSLLLYIYNSYNGN